MLAALATIFAAPADAHARRRCCNGYYGYHGRTYGYTAQVAATSPCGGTAAPTNADGSIAPQPAPAAPSAPQPAPAPEATPPATPPSTAN